MWVALIMVLGGGVVSNCVAGRIQSTNARLALEQQAYEDFLARRLTAVEQGYELIGMIVSASDNLLILLGDRFNPDEYSSVAAREIVEQQRRELRAAYNEAAAEWSRKKHTMGIMLSYYHNGSETILRAWQQAEEAIENLKQCAEKAVDEATATACVAERDDVTAALTGLLEELQAHRAYAFDQTSEGL